MSFEGKTALGVPEKTVVVHDRNLVKADLRTKGGRGPSAAKVTAHDAANLIIAVAGSAMVKDTVATVEDYSRLPSRDGEMTVEQNTPSLDVDGKAREAWKLPNLIIPALQNLPNNHTFRGALVALITAATDGTLTGAIQGLHRKSVQGYVLPVIFQIEVSMWAPHPRAEIRIYTDDFHEEHRYSDEIPIEPDAVKKWEEEYRAKYGKGDLKQIRQFSATTFFALGELLSI